MLAEHLPTWADFVHEESRETNMDSSPSSTDGSPRGKNDTCGLPIHRLVPSLSAPNLQSVFAMGMFTVAHFPVLFSKRVVNLVRETSFFVPQ